MTGIPADLIVREAGKRTDAVASLLRELVAVPSFSGSEGAVVARVAEEMEGHGFDRVRVDPFGNVQGRMGSGPRLVAFDAHLDTVEPGELSNWEVDPFAGALKDGVIFGRGASDQKGGMASLLLAGAVAKKAGLPEDVTILVVGSVQEEDCDGLCWQYLVREESLLPEAVVLTEPTNLQVYRGQRGRMEMEVEVKGVSCHGSAPERGVNAVTLGSRIALEIDRLGARLAEDPFLGKGSVTVTRFASSSPSLCAVPDFATLHLDRRLTWGETPEGALEEVESLEAVREAGARVAVPTYDAPTHTGLVYPTRAEFPAWLFPEDHSLVEGARRAACATPGTRQGTGHWTFSTNGVATAGLFGIPTVGFGPGDEVYAHGPSDQVPVDHLVKAAVFYALFPWFFSEVEG